MKQYLLDFFEEFDYPEEAREELLEAYGLITEDGFARGELEDFIRMYNENIRADWGNILGRTEAMSDSSGAHKYKIELLVFILLSKKLRERYIERGIDTSIWHNSMLDLKYKLLECKAVKNIWGSFVAKWFPGFFTLTRFALGRLQFETCRYNQRDYTKGDKTIKNGETAIGVHIPRTLTPLDKKSYDEAFDMAREFFRGKTGDAPMAFVCSSWLLYPDNLEFLPEKSNVRRFMLEFDIINSFDAKTGEYPHMWRLFDMDYTGNLDDYPEDTSLRRAFKSRLKSGGKIGEGYGIFFA